MNPKEKAKIIDDTVTPVMHQKHDRPRNFYHLYVKRNFVGHKNAV